MNCNKSYQNLLHDSTLHVGVSNIAPAVTKRESYVIEAKLVPYRGVQVAASQLPLKNVPNVYQCSTTTSTKRSRIDLRFRVHVSRTWHPPRRVSESKAEKPSVLRAWLMRSRFPDLLPLLGEISSNRSCPGWNTGFQAIATSLFHECHNASDISNPRF